MENLTVMFRTKLWDNAGRLCHALFWRGVRSSRRAATGVLFMRGPSSPSVPSTSWDSGMGVDALVTPPPIAGRFQHAVRAFICTRKKRRVPFCSNGVHMVANEAELRSLFALDVRSIGNSA